MLSILELLLIEYMAVLLTGQPEAAQELQGRLVRDIQSRTRPEVEEVCSTLTHLAAVNVSLGDAIYARGEGQASATFWIIARGLTALYDRIKE